MCMKLGVDDGNLEENTAKWLINQQMTNYSAN